MEGANDFEPDYEPSPVPSPHRDELPLGVSEHTRMVDPEEEGVELGEESASEEETQLALRPSSSPEYDNPWASEEEGRPAKHARPNRPTGRGLPSLVCGIFARDGEYNVIPLVIQTRPSEVRALPTLEATTTADPLSKED